MLLLNQKSSEDVVGMRQVLRVKFFFNDVEGDLQNRIDVFGFGASVDLLKSTLRIGHKLNIYNLDLARAVLALLDPWNINVA